MVACAPICSSGVTGIPLRNANKRKWIQSKKDNIEKSEATKEDTIYASFSFPRLSKTSDKSAERLRGANKTTDSFCLK